ncbi:MAG: prephenate dehydrogenase/arogenate dehydrogenase family protein [Bacteroidales bacterium]|nr:prephenate dehydrogenase/arogenate dehydrogenase family protein [Bacteroidales bacterium]
MKVGIIGLGLIGGSLSKDLENWLYRKLIGVDRSALHCEKAMDLKLVDEILDMETAIQKSDLLIICTPVDVICSLLPGILDKIAGSRNGDGYGVHQSGCSSCEESSLPWKICCRASHGRNRVFGSGGSH